MNFANPQAFWLALLAIPIVGMYLRRQVIGRFALSTAFLWEEIIAAHPRQMAWRRWRTGASVVVQITILLLLVLALAMPVWWIYPAWAAVVLLTIEWSLHQRRWLV
jgi:hypothetical protein